MGDGPALRLGNIGTGAGYRPGERALHGRHREPPLFNRHAGACLAVFLTAFLTAFLASCLSCALAARVRSRRGSRSRARCSRSLRKPRALLRWRQSRSCVSWHSKRSKSPKRASEDGPPAGSGTLVGWPAQTTRALSGGKGGSRPACIHVVRA